MEAFIRTPKDGGTKMFISLHELKEFPDRESWWIATGIDVSNPSKLEVVYARKEGDKIVVYRNGAMDANAQFGIVRGDSDLIEPAFCRIDLSLVPEEERTY